MIQEIMYILDFVLTAVKGIGMFFVLGIAIASVIKTFNLDGYLKKAFEGKKVASIPIATSAGAFSPLCSCGVIPAIASLLASGVPMAPIMAFWITSPLMDPEVFILTYGLLGKDMAVARLIATLLIGLCAGFGTLYFSNRGLLDNQILKSYHKNEKAHTTADQNDESNLSKKERRIIKLFEFLINFKELGLFIGKFILIAFVLEAIILKYVPMDWVGTLLGSGNPFGPLIAAFIGVPAYASSISSMPIVRGLMDLGMDKGTALSFMIAGAATSIPAMVAVFSIVKKRTFFLYITFSMLGAILSGYTLRLVETILK